MFYNGWISFVSENYLFLSVCAALNVYYFRWDTPGNVLNSLLTVIVGTVLGLYLLFVPCFYLRRKNYLLINGVGGAQDETFLARFGGAIEGLNFFRQGRKVILFPIIWSIRMLAYVAAIIFMHKRPGLSI